MLNKILLRYLSQDSALSNNQSKAMLGDDFEEASHYKGWIYPFRYLLALRYLKHKQQILTWFRAKGIYPVLDDDFHVAILEKLSGKSDFTLTDVPKKSPITAMSFKSKLIYPVLIAGLLFGSFTVYSSYKNKKIDNVLAHHLPYFTDLLHQRLLLKHNNGSSRSLKIVDEIIKKEQEKILSELPQRNNIRALMKTQLEGLKDPAKNSQDIMLGFKELNTLFDEQDLPYYLLPKSFTISCSSLIDAPMEEMLMLKKLEALMSDNKPERCRTTIMTSYKVSERNRLYYKNTDNIDNNDKDTQPSNVELPLFHVKRIDKIPAVDSALGLTFQNGIGSIILSDRIKHFSQESVLPALTFLGRSYIIPYWMQGHYDIEEAVTKGYKKDINRIFPQKEERTKVKSAIKKIIRNKQQMRSSRLQQTLGRENGNGANSDSSSFFGSGLDAISTLLGKGEKKKQFNKTKKKELALKEPTKEDKALLYKLDEVLLPSIEYHEAYHQIDKSNWKEPSWIKSTFKDAKLSKNGLHSTLEELGAYLAQIAHTEEGLNIWLSKILVFSISPFSKGQAEYYASGIILSTMESLYLGKSSLPRYHVSLDDKVKIYTILIKLSNDEKRQLAKKAYEVLFERNEPNLKR